MNFTQEFSDSSNRKLGVVTVTFNAEIFLYSFLECCLVQTHANFELLVIDNCSSDNTLKLLSNVVDSRVTLISNLQNIGYSAACNQAVSYFYTRGMSDILFINNDTEFSDDLFKSLQNLLCDYQADAITPRITLANNPDNNWYDGGKFTFWKGFQGEHLGEGQLNDSKNIEPRWVEVATGCCVMFPMTTFDRVGLFDPNYFVYFEDTDYFVRMGRLQLQLLYVPAVAVAHKISLSTGGVQSDFSIRYYQRNQIYLLRKHFGLLIVLSQAVLIFMKASVRFLIGRDNFRQYLLRIDSLGEGFKMPIHKPDTLINAQGIG